MKKHFPFRILPILAGALFMSAPSLQAQQSSAPGTAPGVLPGPLSIEIQVPASARAGAGGIYLTSDDAPVHFSVITTADPNAPLLLAVLPAGTPLNSLIKVSGDDFPLLHVTVADILGNSQNDYSDVIVRPVWFAESTHDYSNSISTPPGAGGGSTPPSTGIKTKPDVLVFPNPTTEHLTIVTEGEILWGVVEVLDITGKKTGEIPTGAQSPVAGTDRVTLYLGDLKAGIYLFRFKTDKNVYTRKVQVTR